MQRRNRAQAKLGRGIGALSGIFFFAFHGGSSSRAAKGLRVD